MASSGSARNEVLSIQKKPAQVQVPLRNHQLGRRIGQTNNPHRPIPANSADSPRLLPHLSPTSPGAAAAEPSTKPGRRGYNAAPGCSSPTALASSVSGSLRQGPGLGLALHSAHLQFTGHASRTGCPQASPVDNLGTCPQGRAPWAIPAGPSAPLGPAPEPNRRLLIPPRLPITLDCE